MTSTVRVEWVKIGNLGGSDEIITSLGGGQYLTLSTAANSAPANTGVSVGYPQANNSGCYARVTVCSANAAVVLASPNTSLTFTEDLGVRVAPGQTVFLKAQGGWLLYGIAATS